MADPPDTVGALRLVVEQCAKEVRQHANALSPNSIQAALDSRFSLILGVASPEPHIYTLASTSCLTREERRGFACIGSGEILAEYILDGLPLGGDAVAMGLVSIYAVEIVKGKDNYCSGPTRVGHISQKACGPVFEKDMEQFAKDCLEFEAENQKQWAHGLMQKVIGNFLSRDRGTAKAISHD